MRSTYYKPQNGTNCTYTKLKASGQTTAMPQKPQKSAQTAHYIELGSYQYWPVLVPRGIRLYTYEQIPVFLRENPYITDGYRAYLPSRLCIKSLFILSNETVNIWSHLLGFLLFFFIGVYNMATVLPAIGASKEDYVIYSIGLFCFQLCMLCSVGYHLFCCHRSEKTSRRWLALDYAGVSIGILGCYVPGVFYTFYCNNYWRQVYLVTVLAMILAVFFAQIHPHYLGKQWKQMRSLTFCLVAGFGLIPTLHWICLTGGFSSELVQLNYLGSSHQVWHLLLVLMFYWWHQSSCFIMAYRHSEPCPNAPHHD
ncbi:Progestin and adipoQ receptor family member 3 [Dissostichus eleginoides]|uniref:Progestin and adipoQ receptor family member 3 n=1 Tax=Dissostichus eleginoides TaxID=100907 RepID=A0AAD9BYF7_DISEL|nr:Progestin and adipoQ receptor family member 3 [Dissostichus eleginoides]